MKKSKFIYLFILKLLINFFFFFFSTLSNSKDKYLSNKQEVIQEFLSNQNNKNIPFLHSHCCNKRNYCQKNNCCCKNKQKKHSYTTASSSASLSSSLSSAYLSASDSDSSTSSEIEAIFEAVKRLKRYKKRKNKVKRCCKTKKTHRSVIKILPEDLKTLFNEWSKTNTQSSTPSVISKVL